MMSCVSGRCVWLCLSVCIAVSSISAAPVSHLIDNDVEPVTESLSLKIFKDLEKLRDDIEKAKIEGVPQGLDDSLQDVQSLALGWDESESQDEDEDDESESQDEESEITVLSDEDDFSLDDVKPTAGQWDDSVDVPEVPVDQSELSPTSEVTNGVGEGTTEVGVSYDEVMNEVETEEILEEEISEISTTNEDVTDVESKEIHEESISDEDVLENSEDLLVDSDKINIQEDYKHSNKTTEVDNINNNININNDDDDDDDDYDNNNNNNIDNSDSEDDIFIGHGEEEESSSADKGIMSRLMDYYNIIDNDDNTVKSEYIDYNYLTDGRDDGRDYHGISDVTLYPMMDWFEEQFAKDRAVIMRDHEMLKEIYAMIQGILENMLLEKSQSSNEPLQYTGDAFNDDLEKELQQASLISGKDLITEHVKSLSGYREQDNGPIVMK